MYWNPILTEDENIGFIVMRCEVDANLLKLLSDAGTVAIVVYVLVNVLSAYHTTVTRLTDLLENMIDDLPATGDHKS